jgi:predicted DNA-binding protein
MKKTKTAAFSYRPSVDHARRLDRLIQATGHKKAFFLDEALEGTLPALEAEHAARLRALAQSDAALNDKLVVSSTVSPDTAARVLDTVKSRVSAVSYKLRRKQK